jgi:ribokinase
MTGRVVVLGSVNVDLLVTATKLPTPGETVQGHGVTRQLGGKGANQAVAAAKAGATTILVAAVGEDLEGASMVDALRGYGVGVDGVVRVPTPTGIAVVVTTPTDNQIVVAPGANAAVDARLASTITIAPADVCLTQRETSVGAAKALFSLARATGATTILNAAPADEGARELLPLTDVLIVNESEFRWLSGMAEGETLDDIFLAAGVKRMGLADQQVAVVTLGAHGLAIMREGAIARIAGEKVKVVDTTGAGDCFCGYLAAGLARGDRLETAAVEANVAASIAVQSLGAASSAPARSSILAALGVAAAGSP